MAERTCSVDECHRIAKARGWCPKHYLRWYTGGTVELLPTAEACKTCAGDLPPKGKSGPRSSYCSPRCRSKAARPRQAIRSRELAAEKVAARPPVACRVCGAEYPDIRGHLYCSPYCAHKAAADNPSRSCSIEGCKRPHRAKGMCNMHWRRAARADGRESNPEWDERRQANWSRRSALKRGTVAEMIARSEVFARDGWLCGICDLHVDAALAWPDPMSASLDHILPLSKGGPHLLVNVQLAHLVCNISKGDRVVA